MTLEAGQFVRVKSDHEDFFRRGKDGMVIEDLGNQVGLVFDNDRHNWNQHCSCVGTELWDKSELDLTTVY